MPFVRHFIPLHDQFMGHGAQKVALGPQDHGERQEVGRRRDLGLALSGAMIDQTSSSD
jgi:hypothetical protein